MYPVFSGSSDKRLLMSLLLDFKEHRRRPVVTISDKHMGKTKRMTLAAH